MPKVQVNVQIDSEIKAAAQKKLRELSHPISLSAFVERCMQLLVNGDGKK